MNIKITGSGSYIPNQIVTNLDFAKHQFLNEDGSAFNASNEVIAHKFKQITGIEERRYVDTNLVTSDIAFLLLKKQLILQKLTPKL